MPLNYYLLSEKWQDKEAVSCCMAERHYDYQSLFNDTLTMGFIVGNEKDMENMFLQRWFNFDI